MPNTTIGLRPLTPSQPVYQVPARGGQVNRLVPLDGGDRDSMVPQNNNFANDPTVRLQ
jgi:hypothetical protein